MVWSKIKLKLPNAFLFLTHGGGGQGLTPNKLCGAHAPQEVTELPRRCQVDSTEIQAAKEIDFGKWLICILKQPSNKRARFNISLKLMTTTEAFFPCKTHTFPGSLATCNPFKIPFLIQKTHPTLVIVAVTSWLILV